MKERENRHDHSTFIPAIERRRRGLAASAGSARADNAPGVTDTEIKIGQTMPYSGPASAYGVIGRTETAYFKMINEQGGVNGRKINLISLDDAYSPPKTVEQVRRLVEEEKVAFLFQTLGTPPNLAIRQYLNDNKVPQLFVATGASHVLRSRAFSLDDGLQTELPDGGAHLRQAHPGDQAGRQDRGALPERRLRQGLSDRTEGRSRRGPRRHDGQGGFVRDFGTDGRFANRDACRARAPTCSSSPRRRNSPPRRSASPTTSAGTRSATSPTSRCRSQPS